MKKLKLINESNQKYRYQLQNGKRITIDVSDDSHILITDENNDEIGKFELSYKDNGMHYSQDNYYITWMYLDLKNSEYTHQGIGRQALILFKENYGLPITAASNDGIRRDDGSHLTGDAPGFVGKMREEGIID